MKVLFLCLALAGPAYGGHPGAALAPIALYTQFAENPPEAVWEALQSEVRTIMAPIGLNFEWRQLSSATGSESSVELAVINFKGRCDAAGLLPQGSAGGPLGWTHISDGVILPFADVDCGAVRGFIQKELLTVRAAARPQALGRALGRVLAHELYHIFANTTRHGSDGVGREFYSVQDLLASDFQFEARETAALKGGKAHLAVTKAAHTDAPTP